MRNKMTTLWCILHIPELCMKKEFRHYRSALLQRDAQNNTMYTQWSKMTKNRLDQVDNKGIFIFIVTWR